MADPTSTDTSGWADALNTALKLYGAWNASKPGKFRTVPQSPEETALLQKQLGYIDHSPTRDFLGNALDQYSQGKRFSTFDLPTSQGFTPGGPHTVAPYNPNSRPGGLDMHALLANYAKGIASTSTGAPSSSTGAPGSTGASGGGIPAGATSGGASTPFTLGGDPSSPQTNPGGISGTDWSAVQDFAKTYGRAAGEGVLALLSSNPYMGVKAAIDAYRAYLGSQGPANYDPNKSYQVKNDDPFAGQSNYPSIMKGDPNPNPVDQPFDMRNWKQYPEPGSSTSGDVSQPTNYDASAMLGGQFTGDPWSVGRGNRSKP